MRLPSFIPFYAIVLTCLCLFFKTYGQDKLDSLLRVDSGQANENKDRTTLWVEIAKEYQYKNTAKGLLFADEALVAARRFGDTDELASALDAKGELYYRSGQHEQATASLDSALEIFQHTGNKRGISSVYADFGMVYWQTSEWQKAIKFFNQSIAIAESEKDEQTAGDS